MKDQEKPFSNLDTERNGISWRIIFGASAIETWAPAGQCGMRPVDCKCAYNDVKCSVVWCSAVVSVSVGDAVVACGQTCHQVDDGSRPRLTPLD
ncbi:unnamed protein product [Colias eurytheme]|nr:unnamed protein product [Colias eurytheme]